MPIIPDGVLELAIRIDEPTGNLSYIGKAELGSVNGDAVWKIQRITKSGKVTTILWADGDDEFDNVWDDRASLSYS